MRGMSSYLLSHWLNFNHLFTLTYPLFVTLGFLHLEHVHDSILLLYFNYGSYLIAWSFLRAWNLLSMERKIITSKLFLRVSLIILKELLAYCFLSITFVYHRNKSTTLWREKHFIFVNLSKYIFQSSALNCTLIVNNLVR